MVEKPQKEATHRSQPTWSLADIGKSYVWMGAFGTCNQDECEEVLPWDMPAVAINGSNIFCSPSCAMKYLFPTEDIDDIVSIHDPQDQADYEYVRSSDAWYSTYNSVDIHRRITNHEEAGHAMQELTHIVAAPYRISFDPTEMEVDTKN